ncbi:hypothetical protein EV359DRAFT_65621 [Lentinula novae-zelandiae]|nr:hypothetical protein EV359DRAFT_65621 [Lentinula novae-zelandiae]
MANFLRLLTDRGFGIARPYELIEGVNAGFGADARQVCDELHKWHLTINSRQYKSCFAKRIAAQVNNSLELSFVNGADIIRKDQEGGGEMLAKRNTGPKSISEADSKLQNRRRVQIFAELMADLGRGCGKYWYIHPEKKALLSAFAAMVSASQILLGKQEWEYEQFSACIMWCETGVRSPKNPVGCTQFISSIAHTMIKAGGTWSWQDLVDLVYDMKQILALYPFRRLSFGTIQNFTF